MSSFFTLQVQRCLAADSQLLVGWDNSYFYFGISGGNHALLSSVAVLLFVQFHTEVTQIADNFLTNRDCVLTDTGGKDDRIHAVHSSYIAAYEFSDAVAENIQSVCCILVSVLSSLVQVTEVAGEVSGQTVQTGFLVQNVHNACNIQVLFLGDELHDSRINITGTGSHYHTFQRGKTHGSIDTFAVYNSADGGTVAQMADDNFGVVFVKSQELNGTFGNEAVGGSVETVSSYFVFLVVIQRQTIEVSFRRHGLMESGIEIQLPAERRASARSRH